jgi:outer membrane receptor for ferrienterochelin and colicins
MSEIIFTDRQQFVSSATRKLGEGSLRFSVATPGTSRTRSTRALYKADQTQYYLEASTQQPLGATLLTVGLTYRYEDLSSVGTDASGVPNDGIDNYKYRTPGVFLQAYHAFLDGRRRSQWFGALRQAQRFRRHHQPAPERAVEPYTRAEQSLRPRPRFPGADFLLRAGSRHPRHARIVRQVDKAEISDNASYALSYAGDRLAFAAR